MGEEFPTLDNITQKLYLHNFEQVINRDKSFSTSYSLSTTAHSSTNSSLQTKKVGLLTHPLSTPSLSKQRPDKKILALDLDETLIYTIEPPYQSKLPTHQINLGSSIYLFVERPNLQEFLENMSCYYTLVLFTSSSENYARQILNIIDPHHYISQAYTKASCTNAGGFYLKDLSTVTNDMESIVLVDNNAACFCQLPNCLGISSFMGEENDNSLVDITKLLLKLTNYIDIREGLSAERNNTTILSC